MRLILRTAIGLVMASAGLTFLTYGIAQAIETGSCGTNSEGFSVGPACPSGFGPMILLMISGTFLAIAGAAIAGVLLRFVFVLIVAVVAGIVIGFVDLHADDSRPGMEVVAVVLAPMLLFALPGVGRRRRAWVPPAMPGQAPTMAPPDLAARPQWESRADSAPASPAHTEDIASRLRQLDQLKESGLLDEAAYKEQRKKILAEL